MPKEYRVVHAKIIYPSVVTGKLVEHVAGDLITDINPTNWLITEGLVIPRTPDDDPAAIRAAAAVPGDTLIVLPAAPPPDLTIAVTRPPAKPARRRAQRKA
jgi:hypothetical protein